MGRSTSRPVAGRRSRACTGSGTPVRWRLRGERRLGSAGSGGRGGSSRSPATGGVSCPGRREPRSRPRGRILRRVTGGFGTLRGSRSSFNQSRRGETGRSPRPIRWARPRRCWPSAGLRLPSGFRGCWRAVDRASSGEVAGRGAAHRSPRGSGGIAPNGETSGRSAADNDPGGRGAVPVPELVRESARRGTAGRIRVAASRAEGGDASEGVAASGRDDAVALPAAERPGGMVARRSAGLSGGSAEIRCLSGGGSCRSVCSGSRGSSANRSRPRNGRRWLPSWRPLRSRPPRPRSSRRVRSSAKWKLADLVDQAAPGDSRGDVDRGRTSTASALRPMPSLWRRGEADRPGPSRRQPRTSRRDMLETILVPSKVIDEKYRDTTFVLTTGKVVAGRIVGGMTGRCWSLRMRRLPSTR